MLGPGAPDAHLAAGEADSDQEGRRFDPVGDGAVRGGVQLVDAFDLDPRGSRAGDTRAHRRQERGEVGHLGLARRVLDHRRPLGERGSHQDVVGRGVARELEHDARPDEAVTTSFDITVLASELRAELGERPQVDVDRAGAEVVTAGQRDARRAVAREKRPEHDDARPHLLDELVGRDRGAARGGRDDERAVVVALDLGADRFEHLRHDRHVGDPRDVLEPRRALGQAGTPPSA